MTKEQQKVDADRAKVGSSKVPKSEVDRLYRPITVRLGADKTNKGTSYPEYDKLFAGGVKPDTLVIGLVGGMLDHDHKSYAEDSGYSEWMTTLREIFEARKGFELKKVEPAVDTTTVTVGGKTYTGITFQNVMSWTLDRTGYPPGSSYQEQAEIRKAMGDKLAGRWLTFSAPIRVANEAGARDATIEIYTYFGAGSDSAPHKQAIKNSDVFIYNGHSYIGYGPLDPSRYSAADFPNSYQILFIDGCVSYNYYEKDFFPLKPEGTKTLDMITNGLEAPSWQSGYALGRFLARLVDGSLPSYRELLDAAEATDALRVVDGEVDNTFNPTKKRLVVADR